VISQARILCARWSWLSWIPLSLFSVSTSGIVCRPAMMTGFKRSTHGCHSFFFVVSVPPFFLSRTCVSSERALLFSFFSRSNIRNQGTCDYISVHLHRRPWTCLFIAVMSMTMSQLYLVVERGSDMSESDFDRSVDIFGLAFGAPNET